MKPCIPYDIELTATLAELKTKRFNNIRRQEQMSEKIWHLERRVMEQRVEGMEVAEALTKTRSELKGLKERWRTLSPLLDSEQYWIETVGGVSVCVSVAIGDSLSLLQEFYHVFSQLNTDQQESTHLEAAISILDTMEGVLAIAETLSCVMVCSECIQLVTEDAVNKKRCGHEERQQEWTDVKLQYLLQLRHSIVTCVCIRMMRDELESSESHDKVPTLLTAAALSGYLSHYQRLGELFEELSVVQ